MFISGRLVMQYWRVFVFFLFLVYWTPALAERRVALVIGEGGYLNAPKLTNPAHDAAAMEKLFSASGFDIVTRVTDASREQISTALRKFERDSEDADVSIVFYSGHGLEIGGENYLIPVDAKIETERDVKFETVSLSDVRDAVDGAKKLKLILLDACRDDPFANQMQRKGGTKGVERGLAPIRDAFGVNVIIAFAAAPGQTAADGDGQDSPFTSALIKNLTAARARNPGRARRRARRRAGGHAWRANALSDRLHRAGLHLSRRAAERGVYIR